MKRILATTALVLLAVGPVSAQTATTTESTATTQGAAVTPGGIFLPTIEHGIRASHFIGKRVYTAENDVGTDPVAGQSPDWNDIGEVSDVILSPAGGVDAVLVDVGGFLGIGEKTVAVDLSQIHRVADSSSPDNYFLVFKGTKAELESAPKFTEAMAKAMDNAATAVGNAAEGTANAVATGAAATGAAVKDLAQGAVDFTARTADEWKGTRVYDPAGNDIGEVSAVATDGQNINAFIVDVGGFLGIGEHRVALNKDMLTVVPDADGSGTHVQVNATEDQLKALPKYEG